LHCKDLAPAARPAGLVAYTAGLLGMNRFSDELFARSLVAAEASGELAATAGVLGAETMLRVGQGDWAKALPLIERTLELSRRGLDSHDRGSALTLAGLAHYYRGSFEIAADAFRELQEMAVANRRDQHRAWAAFALAQTMIPRGDTRRAIALLKEAEELLIHQEDNVSLMICRSVLAAAYVRQGDFDSASGFAREAAKLSTTTPPRNFGSLEGYAGPVEALLALAYSSAPGSASRDAWLAEASRAMPALASYARLFRIGRPRLRLARGWAAFLAGRTRKARREWQASIHEARGLSARYDELRAECSIEIAFENSSGNRAQKFHDLPHVQPHPLVI
jgi:tetratricopeptide (TPR) repeat protein